MTLLGCFAVRFDGYFTRGFRWFLGDVSTLSWLRLKKKVICVKLLALFKVLFRNCFDFVFGVSSGPWVWAPSCSAIYLHPPAKDIKD